MPETASTATTASTHEHRETNGTSPYRGNDLADTWALVGYFDTPKQIYACCEKLRDAGYRDFDAHTPFPVHGLEIAMGLKPSRMPWISLAGGAAGLSLAVWLAFYTQAVWYPQNVGGKAPFAYQAFIPIFFELTVLFAAFATFFGLWAVNKLPMFFHPVMQHPSFPRATDDKFFIAVEAKDAKFHPIDTRALLEQLGAKELMEIAP